MFFHGSDLPQNNLRPVVNGFNDCLACPNLELDKLFILVDPYKPPAISMFTPSGRFKTNTQLCMSMTNYHPESWNPMWSVGTILNGLLSFMQESAVSTGSISTTSEIRRQLALESLQWNSTNLSFKRLFPEYMELAALRLTEKSSASSLPEAQAQASGSVPQAPAGGPRQAQVGTDPPCPSSVCCTTGCLTMQHSISTPV